jgi:hypothetical protein
MPQTLPLKNNALAQPLDADIALFRALADLLAKAPLIAQALKSSTDLTAALAAVKGVLGADDYQTLASWLGKVASATGVLPQKYWGLLDTIHDLAGNPGGAASIGWTITTPTAAAPAAPPEYSFNFSGNASLTFNAADKWPSPPAGSDQLLSVKAEGKVDVGASATVPFDAFGKLKVGGDASLDISIAYYFKPSAGDLYVSALANALLNLADPYDLASVWECFGKGLQGVVYTYTGDASVQVQVTIADSVALGDGVQGELGATVAVTAGVSGTYASTLYKTASPSGFGVSVKLNRGKTSTADISGNVGVSVDLSPLTKPLSDLVATIAADWNAALDKIKPFLSPGTWLQQNALQALKDEIGKAVKDPDLRQALITDSQGALAIGAPMDEALSTWLLGKIGSALDLGSALVDGDIDKAVSRVVAQLGASAPAFAQTVANNAEAMAAQAVKQAEKGLEDAISNAIGPAKTDLAGALKAAGVEVSGVANTLNTALAPVRDLLNKIDTVFQTKILQPVQQALKQKVTAQFTFDDSVSSGASVEVDGGFTADTKETEATFRSLATGNLNALVKVIDGAPTPGFTLDETASAITRFSNSKRTEGVDISFLGIVLSGSAILAADATTVVDGAGNVHVDASANLDKTYNAPLGGARKVSLVETAALVQAGMTRAAGRPPVLELGATASYVDSAEGKGPVADFIQRLLNANLLSADGAKSAHATFSNWSSPDGKINGSIAASLRLSSGQIDALLRLDKRDAGKLNDEAALAIIGAGLNALKSQPGLLDKRSFDIGEGLARGLFASPAAPPGATAEYVVLNYQDRIPFRNLPDPGETTPDQPATLDPNGERAYEYFLQVAAQLLELVDLVQTMGDIYASKAQAGSGTSGWTVADYRRRQEKLLDDSVNWVTVFAWLINPPAVTPMTIAFLRAMCDLAGAPGVVLTLTDKPATGDPKTAAFG